jgi:hypothetical protein
MFPLDRESPAANPPRNAFPAPGIFSAVENNQMRHDKPVTSTTRLTSLEVQYASIHTDKSEAKRYAPKEPLRMMTLPCLSLSSKNFFPASSMESFVGGARIESKDRASSAFGLKPTLSAPFFADTNNTKLLPQD